MTDIVTHDLIVESGKFKGQRWTRVPMMFLKIIANQRDHKHHKIAQAEIKRRGGVGSSDVEVTGHAVDRASQVLIGKWMETRTPDEGLHAWLCRMASAARKHGKKSDDYYHFAGVKFAFAEGVYPILMSVMNDR